MVSKPQDTGLKARAKKAAGKASGWAAAAASAVSGVPVPKPSGPTEMHPGAPTETGYETYMRTAELLALQKAEDKALHHDELMFQVVHQTFELWCKLVLFELKSVGALLDQDRLIEAYPLLERCTHAVKINSEAMHVLETMTPWDFHVIRAGLGQASGAESPGFRLIQQKAPVLWPKVEALLKRRKTSLLQVYTEPQRHPDLLRLCEHLTDFDMFFHVWRLNHLAMVKRVIGRDVKSLKGYAVHQLETDVQGVLWPPLWKVRNQVTDKAGTSPP